MQLTFERAFEKYRAYMLRSNFSERTIYFRMRTLNLFNSWILGLDKSVYSDLRAVSCENILEYMDTLYLKGFDASSVKIYMVRLQLFFRFLYKNDLVSEDPTRKLPVIRVPKKEIVYIPHEKIMSVLDGMCNNMRTKGCRYDTALRDYFIIRVAYVTGWRSCEALACNPHEDINWEIGEIHIPRRKGGKDGFVFLDLETSKMLKQWYNSNYPGGKRLWYSVRGIPLDYSNYNEVFKKRFGLGSHRIRASMATYLISQDVGIKDVADLLGHECISSTMKYSASIKTRIKDIHAMKNPFSR